MVDQSGAVPDGPRALWPTLSLLLLTLLVAWPAFGPWAIFSPDSFQYLGAARAILEGGDLSSRVLQAPPGFPAVIAPLLLLGDLPLLAMRALLAGCWASAAAMTYLLHRRELGTPLAWLAGLLVATSPAFLQLTTTVLSEPVFIVLSLAALLLADSWRRSSVLLTSRTVASGEDLPAFHVGHGGPTLRLRLRRGVPRWPQIVSGALLVAAAILVRMVGFVLLPVMAAGLYRHRGSSAARGVCTALVFGALAVLPTFVWQACANRDSDTPGYLHAWTNARGGEHSDATGAALQFERLVKYGPPRLHALKELLLSEALFWRAYQAPFDRPTTWLIGGGVVLIGLARFVKYRRPQDAYLLGMMLVLALWPWDEGLRFAAPLLPIAAAYPLWLGQLMWRRRTAGSGQRIVLATALGILLAAELGGAAVAQRGVPAQRRRAEQRLAAMRQLADWHVANTPSGVAWLGMTRNGDDRKVLLVGAAYLARRPVQTIDVTPGETISLTPDGADCLFVDKKLGDSTVWMGDFVEVDQVLGFAILKRLVRQREAGMGTSTQAAVRRWAKVPDAGPGIIRGAGNVPDGGSR